MHRHDAVTLDELRALEPDAVLVSPGPGRPEDAGVSNDAIRALRRARRPGARRVPRPPVHRPGLRRRRRAGRAGDARQDVGGHHDGRGRVRRASPTRSPRPATTRWSSTRDSVPDVPRGHRRDRGRPRDGPAPPRAARSRACSSTPSRSSPRPATTSCATSSRLARRSAGGRRRQGRRARRPRDHREAVGDERRERVARRARRTADRRPARSRAITWPAPLAERSRERRLAVADLAGERATRRAPAAQRALGAARARGPAQRSRRRPSARAAGRGRAAARPMRDHRRLGLALGEHAARAPARTTRRTLTSTAGDVGVVGLGEDRGRRCSGRRRAASVRSSGQPSVGDHDARPPRAGGPGAGSRAGPTRRSPRPGRRRPSPPGSGTARGTPATPSRTRGTWVWCSITSETRIAQRSRVARHGRSWRPCVARTRRRGSGPASTVGPVDARRGAWSPPGRCRP